MLLCLAPGCTEFDELEIVTNALPDGQVGQTYAARIETTGGYDVTIRVLSGQLPPGISFTQDDEDAKLDGVPVLAGTYLFTVEARTGHDTLNVKSIVSKGFVIKVIE
jgi:hypothetical protein